MKPQAKRTALKSFCFEGKGNGTMSSLEILSLIKRNALVTSKSVKTSSSRSLISFIGSSLMYLFSFSLEILYNTEKTNKFLLTVKKDRGRKEIDTVTEPQQKHRTGWVLAVFCQKVGNR